MSFTNSGIISMRNNLRLMKRVSYFRNRGAEINRSLRTGSILKKFAVNKNGYAQSQERKALMIEKGKMNIVVFCYSVLIITGLTAWLLG